MQITTTLPSGTRLLWLKLIVAGTTARTGGDPTFDGVAMTAGNPKTDAGGTPETHIETWYLVDPSTAANRVLAVPNSNTRSMTLNAAWASADAGATIAVDNSIETPGDSTNPTTSFTVQDGAIWFGGIGNGAQTWNPSARSGTQIYDWDTGNWGIGSQYGIKSGTGSQTVDWTFGTSEDWVIGAISFKEVFGVQEPVGLSTETDTAFALAAIHRLATGTATEADSAFALSAIQRRAAGLASETDTALPLVLTTGILVGLATETDSAFALAAVHRLVAGTATEADTAIALGVVRLLATGLATETDAAIALAALHKQAAGLATETDTALILAAVQRITAGLATEADTALALSALFRFDLGLASEADTALALAMVLRIEAVTPGARRLEIEPARLSGRRLDLADGDLATRRLNLVPARLSGRRLELE